jgi:hypothetical protein
MLQQAEEDTMSYVNDNVVRTASSSYRVCYISCVCLPISPIRPSRNLEDVPIAPS